MPYHIEVENGRYCVYKDGESNAMQCYQSMDKANAYLTALNIATSNEIKATYIAPQSVADNARLALDVRSEKPQSQQGMTAVGLARANQLANRGEEKDGRPGMDGVETKEECGQIVF